MGVGRILQGRANSGFPGGGQKEFFQGAVVVKFHFTSSENERKTFFYQNVNSKISKSRGAKVPLPPFWYSWIISLCIYMILYNTRMKLIESLKLTHLHFAHSGMFISKLLGHEAIFVTAHLRLIRKKWWLWIRKRWNAIRSLKLQAVCARSIWVI